jgi:hypothetical protein
MSIGPFALAVSFADALDVSDSSGQFLSAIPNPLRSHPAGTGAFALVGDE